MMRLTHENMATAFQITSIIFIFSYSPSPQQGKTNEEFIKTAQVSESSKTGKPVMPQAITAVTYAVHVSKNAVAADRNFFWNAAGQQMITGAEPVPVKQQNAFPALASFSNFTETLLAR